MKILILSLLVSCAHHYDHKNKISEFDHGFKHGCIYAINRSVFNMMHSNPVKSYEAKDGYHYCKLTKDTVMK